MPEEALKLGAARLKESRLVEAQREFYRALDLSGKNPDVALRIADLWRKAGWGLAMSETGDPEAGWTCFHNARAMLWKFGGDVDALAQVHRGLAIAASKLGEHEEAVALCREATSSDPEERMKLLNTQAIALNKLGRGAEARACAEAALALGPDPKMKALLRQSIGVACILEGRPEAALPLLSHELLRAWALVEAGRWKEVLGVLKAERTRGHLFRAKALEGLGRTREALAELLRGTRAYEEGRARMDTEAGRSGSGGTRQEAWGMLVELSLKLGKEPLAFRCAEAGRARSFLDFVLDGRRRELSHLRPAEERRLAKRREDVERLKKSGGAALETAERELRMSLRRYEKEALAEARIQPRQPLTARQISAALGKGEAVVEYHLGIEKVQAFVLTQAGCRRVELGISAPECVEAAGDLGRVVSLMRRGERMGSPGFFEWHARVLREGLFGGLGLEGVERLVVVPHGALHRVPFGALLPGVAVSLAPSASVYVQLAARANDLPTPRTCLLVKDPTETLEHADGEEEALRARFGKGLTVLPGPEATREAVIASAKGKDILHFATHAVFRPERPEFSYLELANEERLHAFDVLDLDLKGTRLVTLSACDSGRGDEARAGELIGLPRAFLRAGAPAVLATLWPIEDSPAVGRIMGSFYAGLQESGPSEALARAMAQSADVQASIRGSFAVIGW